jgi:hypothetical protein
MSVRFETEFTPWGWIDFESVGCDLCDATYPANGLLGEQSRMEAHDWYGWQIDRVSGRACCPDCHRRAFNIGDGP